MEPLVRIARSADLPGVLALYRELRPSDPELLPSASAALFDRILRDPDTDLVVSEQDGCLASTCMLAIVPNLASGGRAFGIIEHVVTLPRFRRQGLGRAVLEFALGLAWSRDCCKVVLLSGVHRTDAHRLYEAVGFRGDIERGFVAKPNDAD